MKLTSALTTLVTLTTFAHAIPNAYNFKRQFSNSTGGAGVGAIGTNVTSSVPDNGAGVAAVNTGLTTETVTQTIVTTIAQQFTTFEQTK